MSDIHVAVGGYVTDALDTPDRDAFAEHLASCPSCRREVEEFSETLARLSDVVAVAPPAGLRSEILIRIDQIRPEPPIARHAEPGSAEALSSAPASPAIADIPASAVPAVQVPASRVPAWMLAVAAILLLSLGAAVGAATATVLAEQRAAQQQQGLVERNAVAELLSARDVQITSITMADGTRGSWTTSRGLDRGMFTAARLPATPTGMVYQVWTLSAGAPRPGTVFEGGSDVRVVFDALDRADAVAVTVEPAGGSSAPTSPVMGLAELPR